MDPTDRTDPTHPIERTEPLDPMHRNEFSDQSDQREDPEAMVYDWVRRPSRIIGSSRRLCSSDSMASLHIGPTSCITSEPLTSVRTTPAACPRPMTSSMALPDSIQHVHPEVGVLLEGLVELVEERPLALGVPDEGLEEDNHCLPRVELF